MATKKQREFLKENLPNKFYIKNIMGQEEVFHYYTNRFDYGYENLGELNQVIEILKLGA